MKFAISSGHSLKCRGAEDIIDEVEEARRVVSKVCDILTQNGHDVTEIHDDHSTTQDANLSWLVNQHNQSDRELDVSCHFNAYEHTSGARGTECLYVTQKALASEIATSIARTSGLIDRGPKYRDDLYFLNNTEMPAVLIEVCFVDAEQDVELYEEHFQDICRAIAGALTGEQEIAPPGPDEEVLFQITGSCSHFGGPDDDGVAPDEGLAFIYSYDQRPDLFLPTQPPGTTGLARRLDPEVFYVACRWNYDITSKEMLAREQPKALVRAGDKEFLASPADWGPNSNTGRVADLSPGLMDALGIDTDSQVEVIYPAPGDQPQPGPEPERATVHFEVTATGPVDIFINGTKLEDAV